jgi:hypothetical protein
MTSVSGAKCEIIIPSRCFPFDYRERNIAEFFVCHSRPERCLPTCKGKTLFSRDPSCAHNAERRFCSLEKIGRLQVRCSHTHQIKDRYPERAGLRGLPAHGITLGASAALPQLRACRLLRPVAQAGALSMTSKAICQARRRITVQSRASSEIESIGKPWSLCMAKAPVMMPSLLHGPRVDRETTAGPR